MANIIFYEWDENNRRIPKGKKRKRVYTKCYIGYGYYIISCSDGTRELSYDPFKTSRLPLGMIPKFDDEGNPILE